MTIEEKKTPKKARSLPAPPRAKILPVSRLIHGVELVDDYAWLKAANWQEVLRDPKALPADIGDLLEAENRYSDAVLAGTKGLQRVLKKELRGRILEEDADPAWPDGPFVYYEKYREGGQHEIICRRPRAGGEEQILLDGDRQARGKSFFSLEDSSHSPDHTKLAWSADIKGSELCSIFVRDLKSGKDLKDVVKDSEGVAVWLADSSGFYYVRIDENHRPCGVFLHLLGTDPTHDLLVFEEEDPAWFVQVSRSRSGAYAFITIRGHDANEVWLLDLAQNKPVPRLVEPRTPGLRYNVEHWGEELVIRTNADEAEDFKIVLAPLADPRRVNWTSLVAHRQGRMIVTGTVFKDYIVWLERENVLPRLVIRHMVSGDEHAISFEQEAFALTLMEGLEFDTKTLRFAYSSMTTPQEIFDYDMAARTRVLLKRQEIPSGHNPEDYVTRRFFAPSHDGELVPISLVHRKELALDGTAPLLLYGYGAYGYPLSAAFSSSRLSLVDRGFVWAIAHVRGGTDKGWNWYTNGKLDNKPNTFKDFIAAARFLVQEHYTSKGKIVAQGGSAGGMLMGGIANMAPDLFAGIIADVPFVDVLNTMLDDTLPLTPPEWLEWGNPGQDKQAFETIRSYSPYDNVSAQAYPPILALGGLADPRVTYWEPAKWVARLRQHMSGGGPILLKTNMDAGHGGASGRFDQLDEIALEQAFALACVTGQLKI